VEGSKLAGRPGDREVVTEARLERHGVDRLLPYLGDLILGQGLLQGLLAIPQVDVTTASWQVAR